MMPSTGYAEQLTLTNGQQVAMDLLPKDVAVWRAKARAELYEGSGWTTDGRRKAPFYVRDFEGNLLVRGGASLMWEYARGNGSTASTAAKKYLNATGALGVGNSTAAAANTQTALQGTNLLKAFTAGYPTHTTGSTAAVVQDLVMKSTFGVTEANFVWNEFGCFNKATTANRRMLTRKVQNLLTKTSAASATLTVTVTLS